MLFLRFLVGLGVRRCLAERRCAGSECWPGASRPTVAGIVGAGINVGILLLSQVARIWHVTPESWRWLFAWSALPALLGFLHPGIAPRISAMARVKGLGQGGRASVTRAFSSAFVAHHTHRHCPWFHSHGRRLGGQ
jgi:hypothetical protein